MHVEEPVTRGTEVGLPPKRANAHKIIRALKRPIIIQYVSISRLSASEAEVLA